MSGDRRRPYSYLAAALLAIVVLFVFWTLRDYGPQSAVRRFNQAILAQDANSLGQVIDEPITSPRVQLLIRELSGLGIDPRQSPRMDRQQNEVAAAVLYRNSYGGPVWVVFIVAKTGPTWRINVSKSLAALSRMYGVGL